MTFKVQKILLLVLIVASTFWFAIQDKMHQRIPEALDVYAEVISIVISHANFGIDKYAGYRNVYDTLVGHGFNWDNHEDPAVLNAAIQKAREVMNPSAERMFLSVGDIGYVDYTKAAFGLFGYAIESLLYFYFLVLLVTVVLFFVQFRRNELAMAGLILFLLGHYIVVQGLYGAGYNLWTVHNNRFLSVLGIIPVAHICLLAFSGTRLKWNTFLGAVVQALIFIFILRCRNSANWMVLFFVFVALFGLTRNLLAKKISVLKSVTTTPWPVVVALSCVFLYSWVKPQLLDAEYYSEKNLASHTVWFPIYVGLAIDPTIREIYGPRPDAQKDLDWYFRVACQEVHNEDSRLKARVRQFVCGHAEMTKPLLRILNSWRGWRLDYTQNDQDGARAVLQWLRANGKTEEHIYTFGPEDKVGYPRWFGQCESQEKYLQHEPFNKDLRPFDAKRDFKWREMDRIMGLVVKDAVINHPFRVLKVVLITKPFFFVLFAFMYFLKVRNFWTLGVILITFFVLSRHLKSRRLFEMKKCLVFLCGMFAFSMIVTLVAYPSPHTIADQVVLLTTCVLAGMLYFINRKRMAPR